MYYGCSDISMHVGAGWSYSAFIVANLFFLIVVFPALYVLYMFCDCVIHHSHHTPEEGQEKSLTKFHEALHTHVKNGGIR